MLGNSRHDLLPISLQGVVLVVVLQVEGELVDAQVLQFLHPRDVRLHGADDAEAIDDLIRQSRADTAAYEEFVRKADALVKRLANRQPEAGIPASLHGEHEASVLFNHLGSIAASSFKCPPSAADKAALALRIDDAVREHAPAGWKGDQTREAQVLNALAPLLDSDREATLALFEIIKNQPGYS